MSDAALAENCICELIYTLIKNNKLNIFKLAKMLKVNLIDLIWIPHNKGMALCYADDGSNIFHEEGEDPSLTYDDYVYNNAYGFVFHGYLICVDDDAYGYVRAYNIYDMDEKD